MPLREQITCAKCGVKTERRGSNHKHCRKCGREIRNNRKNYHKPSGVGSGGNRPDCTPITLEEYYEIERVALDRGVRMCDLDEMVGKKGKQYLASLYTRLRDFGHAKINTEVMQAIQHWIETGTD